MKTKRGFTLVELLVVIAIIGLLSSVVLASLDGAKARARDAWRKSALKQLQTALELYYNDNGSYPVTTTYYGVSDSGGSYGTSGAGGYIPGLAPNYIPVLPVDPLGVTTSYSGFIYRSDGTDYKLIIHSTGPESFPSAGEPFYDPARPTWAWAVCVGTSAHCTAW